MKHTIHQPSRKPFRALGSDLYFDLPCTCPSDLFKDSPIAHMMKHNIKLSGYADDYFFDTVNAESREMKCKCGRPFQVQWFRDGVEASFLEVSA